jgi:8-oxo-dGTP pyrophosphatase MutT (NUDIX family)
MIEIFAKPAVGAIIEKVINNKRYILIQDRNKSNDGIETGMIEIPAGKIREYENIFDSLRREVREETGLNIT